jgi:xylulokinase
MAGYLLGFDVGSSSIKASLLEIDTGHVAGNATSPAGEELSMIARQSGWAEQRPETWWDHCTRAVAMLAESHGEALSQVQAIGISYQMHGLVLLDRQGSVLRPSIIWCDSRAVPYGERAFQGIGEKTCLSRLLNSPGNFTAAKLAWVKENEPQLFDRISRVMLPGDYIAYRLTGDMTTTPGGLSEGILWDFTESAPAQIVLDWFGFDRSMLPEYSENIGVHGTVSSSVAEELGIPAGTPVSYRAGDQPNNALSLAAVEPGDVAATAGTSGVVYGVTDRPAYDERSRVNTFVHVNHTAQSPRYGVLLCLNGAGILNRWVKQNLFPDADYEKMNQLAGQTAVGAGEVTVLPFGNGAERTLENVDIGASFHGLNFNIHTRNHVARAAQEGVAYALGYGLTVMKQMGMSVDRIRAGYANMFLSPIFREAFATVADSEVELYSTDGAEGAARGAGLGAGVYSSATEAFVGLQERDRIEPARGETANAYRAAYERWQERLNRALAGSTP